MDTSIKLSRTNPTDCLGIHSQHM